MAMVAKKEHACVAVKEPLLDHDDDKNDNNMATTEEVEQSRQWGLIAVITVNLLISGALNLYLFCCVFKQNQNQDQAPRGRSLLQVVPPTPFTLIPFNPLTTIQLWGMALLHGTLASTFLPNAHRNVDPLFVEDAQYDQLSYEEYNDGLGNIDPLSYYY